MCDRQFELLKQLAVYRCKSSANAQSAKTPKCVRSAVKIPRKQKAHRFRWAKRLILLENSGGL